MKQLILGTQNTNRLSSSNMAASSVTISEKNILKDLTLCQIPSNSNWKEALKLWCIAQTLNHLF